MNPIVSIVPCETYEKETVRRALEEVLAPLGGLSWVTPGMKIAVKVNLVTMLKPETAATTHPVAVTELCSMLTEKGAEVVVGDSPGGVFHAVYLKNVYRVTGMENAVAVGAKLNDDFTEKSAQYPEGRSLKQFDYTAWLDHADVIINFCKLKTHGMMGMSAAVKNIFGVIPGVTKPEYHYRFPNTMDFAHMLVDLNEYFHPVLHLVDAITGMEGNGPTQGTPRHIGALLASENPYHLDLICAKMIGLDRSTVPTIQAAIDRKLSVEAAEEVPVNGDVLPFLQKDFKNIEQLKNIEFFTGGKTGIFSKIMDLVATKALCSRPKVRPNDCVGCKKCIEICPAKAITMKNKLPVIDRNKCIRCFCCQEFCPKGAMIVHRPALAKLLSPKKEKT